ncbi:unnamed protein product [Caenorhabditis bovis]|uniref:HELP domain-containing protein n=1 Tax=Caenorhabditis bovis TaxID=2654633 RepID=A0A8S1EAB0_9PELO|nr:unnamed protein product [Caenorhabditis bovis]
MSLSNGGWSSLSMISDVLPEEEFERDDELVLSENERLRNRVEELEKVVLMQRNEIMLLQASTADILRRVQHLESNNSPIAHQYASLPRSRMSSSRSSYSVPKSASPLPPSRSLYTSMNGVNNNGKGGPEIVKMRSPSRRNGPDMINVSLGKSARGSPMRKWVSTHEIKDIDAVRRISMSSEASTSTSTTTTTSPPIIKTIPRADLHRQSTPSFFSLCSVKPHSVAYSIRRRAPVHPTNGTLPIAIGNKTVTIPIPVDYEDWDPNNEEQEAPDVKLELKSVYTYRGKDVRRNVDVLPTGELLFFTANLVVLWDNVSGRQRFYQGHTCDVRCVALHPNKVFVASGQSSCHGVDRTPRFEQHTRPVESYEELVRQLEREHTEAHVRIWDSVKLATIAIIGGFDANFERGICHVAFSAHDAGVHLACVEESVRHTLTVWNWAKIRKIAEVKAANDVIFECSWHPTISNLIVLYGKGHFSFFQLDLTNGVLLKTPAVFEGRDKPKTVLSMCYTPSGHVVTGDSNGTITIWDAASCKSLKQAHSVHPGGIYALCCANGGRLWSGGKDRMISEWQIDDLVRSRRPIELPDDHGFARILLPTSNSELLIGTSTNSLISANFANGFNMTSLIEGDSEEVSSMVALGADHIIIASLGGSIRRWNLKEHKVEWSKKYLSGIECVDVDSSNTHLLIGFSLGKWSIINMTAQETIEDRKEGQTPIICVKFAPLGGTFVVSSGEPAVIIYRIDASRNILNLAKISRLSSPISSVDWSTDGQFLRANGANLHFWSRNGEVVEMATSRDIKWFTSKCPISFEAALIAHSSGGEICCSARSRDDKLLALGFKDGTVRIYRNPVTSLTAGFVQLAGHGKPIRNATFVNETTLMTSSVAESSIFEWSLS